MFGAVGFPTQTEVAATIACSRSTRCEMLMMQSLVGPLREDFGLMVTKMKTRRGGMAWLEEKYARSGDTIFREIMSTLTCKKFTRKVGLVTDDPGLLDEGQLRSQASLCLKSMCLARNLIKTRLVSDALYQTALPGVFLCSDHTLVEEALEYLQEVWAALQIMGAEARMDKWVENFLSDLVWPLMPWVRSALVALDEVSFRRLPADLAEEIRSWADGFLSSKSVEDAFNICRDAERDSKSGMLCSRSSWHRVMCSHISSDCDRPAPPQTAASATAAASAGGHRPIPASCFQGHHGEFSMGEKMLDTITASPKDWPSHGGPTFPLTGLGTKAMAEAGGDLAVLKAAWKSWLFMPGSLVRHPDSRETSLVLQSSRLGVFLWRVVVRPCRDALIVDLAPTGAGAPWLQMTVSDFDRWQAAKIQLLPPAAAKPYLVEMNVDEPTVLPVVTEHSEPLLVFAARQAFMPMTVPFLSKLYSALNVKAPGTRPTTEAPLVRALVRHLLPGLDRGQVEAIVKLRKRAADELEPDSTVLMDAINMGMTKNLFDDDVQKELGDYHKARGLYFGLNEALRPSGAGSGGGSASSSSGPSSRETISLRGSKTPAWARDYLPPGVPGCCITKDTVRHMRWQTTYPTAAPPSHWSKSWGASCSDEQALAFVLRAVWQAHQEATGQACPFDFGS